MPVFVLTTNLEAAKIPSGFGEKLTDVLAQALSKPASYVVVQINAGANLCFGMKPYFINCILTIFVFNLGGDGKTPAANCRLSSIGGINAQKNKKSSEKIMGYIEKEIGIPSDRMYIEFVDLSPENIGWSGSTF